MRCLRGIYIALLLLGTANGISWAESGVLVVHVKDVRMRPISGVQIGVIGDGGTAITGDDGKARILLAKQTKENDWVALQILKSPPGKDFMMVSPWDYGTFVPSFANESKNVVEIVVVQSGDRAALESGTVLKALTERINKANGPKSADRQAPLEDQKAILAAVASRYGLAPEELDQAIRAWGAKAIDPYDAGLAALYERNYSRASTQLADSLKQREERLAADEKAVSDAAFFLGQSLYEQGRYRDSAAAYQRCLQLRPDDLMILNNVALSLASAGDFAAAEPLYRRALAIDEPLLGTDDPVVAIRLNNLGLLLSDKGDYRSAEPLFWRALATAEEVLGPNSILEATVLNNLAGLLYRKGDYPGAEAMYRRSLAIREANGAPERDVALSLNNLATLVETDGDYTGAEALFREALILRENALGFDHPDVAETLNNLGLLFKLEGRYAEAEPFYTRSLAIDRSALGPEHVRVATDLNNLGVLMTAEGNLEAAEPLCKSALAIREKALGPDHPDVASSLSNLAAVLSAKKDYRTAESLLRRALTIDERSLGAHHPSTEIMRINLQALIVSESAQKTEK